MSVNYLEKRLEELKSQNPQGNAGNEVVARRLELIADILIHIARNTSPTYD